MHSTHARARKLQTKAYMFDLFSSSPIMNLINLMIVPSEKFTFLLFSVLIKQCY